MIRVYAPATSANCCVGFDCMGMALDWLACFTFEKADALTITGCDPAYANEDNLVWKAYELTCSIHQVQPVPLHIDIDCDLPAARGLGSSSACVVAGILAADALHDLHLSRHQMLDVAVLLEGHPDNAAPALFGNLCLSVMDEGSIELAQIDMEGWHALAVIPDYPVLTAQAREVLPKELPYFDAVAQTGHALLFEHALMHRQEKKLARQCRDLLHEPYRAKLIEQYPAMKALADKWEIPFWISGSGSTMLFLSLDENRLLRLANEIHLEYPMLKTRKMNADVKGGYVE